MTLHAACERGDIETVKLLIDEGTGVNKLGIVSDACLYSFLSDWRCIYIVCLVTFLCM